MDRAYLLEVARRASGLTQAELAARSGTSQATMSAYERGLESPTLKVAARILEAAGYDLNLRRLRRAGSRPAGLTSLGVERGRRPG